MALYAILGARKALTALILSFEWLILCIAVLAMSVPVLAFAANGDGDVAGYGIRAVASEALLVYAVAVLYNVVTIVRRPSVYELLRQAE